MLFHGSNVSLPRWKNRPFDPYSLTFLKWGKNSSLWRNPLLPFLVLSCTLGTFIWRTQMLFKIVELSTAVINIFLYVWIPDFFYSFKEVYASVVSIFISLPWASFFLNHWAGTVVAESLSSSDPLLSLLRCFPLVLRGWLR